MRGRLLSVIGVVVMVLFAVPMARADDVADTQALKNFKHIRILLWAFDVKTGALSGFSDAPLRPGESITLEPSPGYIAKFSAGEARRMIDELSVGRQMLMMVPFSDVQLRWTANTAQFLGRPDLSLHYPFPEDTIRTIRISIPVGSLDSPAVSKWMEARLTGTRLELEDLLLAMARDRHITAEMLLHSCALVGQSERLAQWVAMSREKDEQLALLGLTAAARFGDRESLDRYCEKCLTSNLNEQIKQVELLSSMQPSEKLLDTMLLVAALPTPLGRPNEGAIDRRVTIKRAIPGLFPLETIRARLKALVEDARANQRVGLANHLIAAFPQFEEKNGPMPQAVPAAPGSPSSRPG